VTGSAVASQLADDRDDLTPEVRNLISVRSRKTLGSRTLYVLWLIVRFLVGGICGQTHQQGGGKHGQSDTTLHGDHLSVNSVAGT
jgi:hypothetical protein